jgi:hypothetical protein
MANIIKKNKTGTRPTKRLSIKKEQVRPHEYKAGKVGARPKSKSAKRERVIKQIIKRERIVRRERILPVIEEKE